MLTLVILAKSAFSCNRLLSPCDILECVRPMSFTYSSLTNSASCAVLHTRNITFIISSAEYPNFHRCDNIFIASSSFCSIQFSIICLMRMGCGSSHTLNTFSLFTCPKPLCVDCKLLMACLMSP